MNLRIFLIALYAAFPVPMNVPVEALQKVSRYAAAKASAKTAGRKLLKKLKFRKNGVKSFEMQNPIDSALANKLPASQAALAGPIPGNQLLEAPVPELGFGATKIPTIPGSRRLLKSQAIGFKTQPLALSRENAGILFGEASITQKGLPSLKVLDNDLAVTKKGLLPGKVGRFKRIGYLGEKSKGNDVEGYLHTMRDQEVKMGESTAKVKAIAVDDLGEKELFEHEDLSRPLKSLPTRPLTWHFRSI